MGTFLIKEAGVMTHHDLALERSYGLKCDADNDQDRCAADADTLKRGYAERQNDREYSDDSEEYRADQCDLVERVIDEVRSGLARSVARDRTVILLQVVCDLNRIVLNGNIEIVECDDEQEVNHCIQRDCSWLNSLTKPSQKVSPCSS